jgi:hypothetical protein
MLADPVGITYGQGMARSRSPHGKESTLYPGNLTLLIRNTQLNDCSISHQHPRVYVPQGGKYS